MLSSIRALALAALASGCGSESVENPEGCPGAPPADFGDPCEAALAGTLCQYETACGLTTYQCEQAAEAFTWTYQGSEDCPNG